MNDGIRMLGAQTLGQLTQRKATKVKIKPIPKGCKFHDDCFTCPFDDCIWNDSNGIESVGRKPYKPRGEHTILAIELLKQGDLSYGQIAKQTGYSKSGVQGLARRVGTPQLHPRCPSCERFIGEGEHRC